MKPWKNSASLIIMTKDILTRTESRNNINILMQKRSSKSPAFPDTMVFPGGVLNDSDRSHAWLNHFKTFGIGNERFAGFRKSTLHPLTLDGDELVSRHLSLRITAIRETFEETGILICKKNTSSIENIPWASHLTDLDVPYWQEKVNSNADNFFTLCQQLDCYPDLWSIYLWSNWLTPVKLPGKQTPRFNTVFFIAAFKERPDLHAEKKEVASLNWSRADDLLTAYDEKKVLMIYPQWYELSRFNNLKNTEELIEFAHKRNNFGCDLLFPSQQHVSDGICILMPGDEHYPSSPDFINGNEIYDNSKSLEEWRSVPDVVHRSEMRGHRLEYFTKNFVPPFNHVSISDTTFPGI